MRIRALLLAGDHGEGGVGEAAGSEAAKFRLWVKSKGLQLGKEVEGEEQEQEEEQKQRSQAVVQPQQRIQTYGVRGLQLTTAAALVAVIAVLVRAKSRRDSYHPLESKAPPV